MLREYGSIRVPGFFIFPNRKPLDPVRDGAPCIVNCYMGKQDCTPYVTFYIAPIFLGY